MEPTSRIRRYSRPMTLGLALIAVVVAGGLGLGAARATDSPDFCRAACHEMRPYVDAWQSSPHSAVSCVECHVEPGTVPRLAHKVTALGEVKSHFFGNPVFPGTPRTRVPDERCVSCHPAVMTTTPGFDHALHASRRDCQDCHSTTGHKVTEAALRDAEVLASSAATRSAGTAVAVVDAGRASLAGHVTVSCSRCHDMARTECGSCHTARHDGSGAIRPAEACGTCHAPGAEFVFTHPVATTACESCHEVPQRHVYTGSCTSCHQKTGDSWAFEHPRKTACAQCHERPAKHRPGSCASCHRVGSSWAFRHPSTGACTDCHARPSGHATGSCTSCHRASGSWAFRHVSSAKCSSCHRAPSSHFGSSCASCHSPTRSWSSARISHPRIRGGEHSYRSFACSSCHPRGYGSASCLKCHDSNSGGGDDEDDD